MGILRNAIQHVVETIGVEIEQARPNDPETMMRLRSPVWRLDLDLEHAVLVRTEARTDLIVREIDHVRDQLFIAMREHIARHDAAPHERLERIETTARTLLDAMGTPVFNSGKVGDAWYTLDRLLRSNPGSVSWAVWRKEGRTKP